MQGTRSNQNDGGEPVGGSKMNRRLWIVVLALVVAVALPLAGCSDDDDVLSGTAPANPAFTGTFVGMVTTTPAGGPPIVTSIIFNLTVNSPLSGDFETGDGVSGDIEGDASGDFATFNATLTDKCGGSLSGDLVLSDGSISMDATGEDCNGPIEVTANADAVPETCDNEIDDDNDDMIDCDDPDCVDDKACIVLPDEICDNKIDDDGDQDIDCDDKDCDEDPACFKGPLTCESAAATDPGIFHCAGEKIPKGVCPWDFSSSFLGFDFTCDEACEDLGTACIAAFDADFSMCTHKGEAACSETLASSGQPDIHCHCGLPG